MERLSHLLFALLALCLFCCELIDASPTLIPPPPPDTLEMGGGQLGYLLTMPQSLPAGSQEQYCLTLHGVAQDTTITLNLVGLDTGDVHEYTHTYVNGESQCNTLQVPATPGTYEVLINETDIFATSQVQVLGSNLITFVQTDKPIYKPGQKVKFRILTMKRDLRSRVGEIEKVFIKDPNDFKVKQYKNIESEGMANLEFQLISDAKLGKWTIEVTVDGVQTTQHFKVDEYVLPRFEVTIDPPSYFLVTSETFDGTVCAKYTYGKPVKGFLNLLVCPSGYGTFGQACATRQVEIDGCHRFSINSSEILSTGRHFYGRRFSIDASVREMATGVQVNSTAQGPEVSYDPLKMEFHDDHNGYFKPGLPVHGKVKVSKPDGSPAVNESILVTAHDYNNEIYLEKVFSTNHMGEIDYSICQGIMENTSTLSMFAEALNFEMSEHEPYGRRLYKPTAHSNLRQWFSPSFSYIQIPAAREELQCGRTLRLNVPFTHDGTQPYIKFHYQVMSRGRIVQTGTTTAPTMSDPLSFLEPDMNSCLEVAEPPTRAPQPTLPPTPPLPDSDNTTDSGEVAPSPPPMVVEPSYIEESSVMVEPMIMPEVAPVVYAEPPMIIEPEQPLLEPAMAEEEKDMADGKEEEKMRRKRSIMRPYGMEGEEEIVRSEDISDRVSNVELSIDVTADMSPTFSVLLFYIRDDGETVADSMQFKVQPCFDNEVTMEFSDKKVSPGEETSIHLEAAAGSVCGIGVVDKSVNILGGDHQITPKKVFDKLAEYSLSRRGYYTYFRNDNTYCREKMEKKERMEAEESLKDGDDDDEGEESEERIPVYMEYWYRSNYVDAVEAFKQMGMLVLTNLVLETRPCAKEIPVYYDAGPLIRGQVPAPPSVMGPEMAIRPQGSGSEDLRSHFPETWLWDLHTVGASGKLDIPHTVPDTITKWVGNSMCISDSAGFGLSPITSITTFQPFFLSFNLPYNAVRGERLPITITVYNYLDKCLHMLLMVDGMKGFKIHRVGMNRQPFCLCGGKSETKKFFITAQDIGKLPIYARAEIVPGQCGNSVVMDTQYVGLTDAVRREVLVKAEGVTQRYSHSLYICPSEEIYKKDFELPLPSDIVPDSARGYVTVIGDILGPALSNLDSLVRMPTGCGEQNMVGFTPNIYVLQYLTATSRLTEAIQDKATHHMEIGYQRELKYRHSDGSFSAFGEKGDTPGSTWLTAFVVKSFAQARPYIYIDEDDLNLSVKYLKTVQNPEEGPLVGCFFERGKVFSSYMQGGLGKNANEAALSAYVLIALLEAGLSTEDSVAVNAIECINRELDVNPDVDLYTLSLVAYANTLYDPTSPITTTIMNRLNRNATLDGDVKHWKRRGEQPKPVNSWYYYSAPSAEVEMTSYALLATLEYYREDAISRAQPIAFWLSNQQSAFGGFSSTQDTVLGLNALSEFAALAYSDEPTDLQVMLGVSGKSGSQMTFLVTNDNSLELQRHAFDVTTEGTSMFVSATGTGCALVQANVYYNKMPNKLGIDDPKFRLRVDPRLYQHDRNRCDRRTIYVTFGQSDTGQFSTGMTMLTVRMVTSWSVIPEALRELKSRFPMLGIERYEMDVEEGVINFYLDQLDTRIRRLALDVEQDKALRVTSPRDAEVQIYQYYEKDVTVIRSYNIRTTCGTKEELPYDTTGVVDDSIIMQRRLPLRGAPALNIGASVGQRRNCPVCDLESAPKNYNEIICNSTAVYKVHAGRNRKYSLKIKANLRPRKKVRDINKFANFRMEEGCQCPLLEPPMKTVLIVTQASNLEGSTLTVDSRTHIFNLGRDRTLEKKARKAQRRCRMD